MKPPSTNVLIRNLSEFDQATLEELKVLLGEKTSSQTLLKLLRNYKQLINKVDVLDKMNESLQADNNELRKKIDNLRNSFKDLQT